MSVTNIPSIPYNGGTINLRAKELTSVALSPTKFVNFYLQTNPNLLFAHVVNVTGLEGGEATSVNGPQFAFGAPATNVRAWAVSNTHILALIGNTLRVFEIDENDEITMTSAKLSIGWGVFWGHSVKTSPYSTTYIDTYDDPANMNRGQLLVGYVHKGSLFLALRELNTTRDRSYWHIVKINYDSSTNTLTSRATVTNIEGGGYYYKDPIASYYTFSDIRFKSIPGSDNFLVTIVNNGEQADYTRQQNSPYLYAAKVINNDGYIIRDLNVASNRGAQSWNGTDVPPVMDMVAMSDNMFIGLIDGGRMRVHAGSTQHAPSSSQGSVTGSFSGTAFPFAQTARGSLITHAEAINGSYFLMVLTAPVAKESQTTNMRMMDQYYRIVRFVDADFSEIIESSIVLEDNFLGKAVNFDQQLLQRLGEYTFLFKSKASASETDPRITLRTIFGGDSQ